MCEIWGKKEGKIEKRILDENNVMEEFGNEKKKRKNNSSSLGKLIEVNFDRRCKVVGGLIYNYMLEK